MNPSTITRHLITALVMVIAMLWLWPTVAHAQSTTTIHGAGLQPLVEESGSTQTLNIYGSGGVIIAQVATDSPVGGTPTTQTRYLLHDHLGSTRVVLDSNNQVLGSFDYSPFGETTPTGNVANVAYRYTGQEVNGALGTYNYHARQYDAGVGRFLKVDPARYNASPYLYANDNPVYWIDKTGNGPNKFNVEPLRMTKHGIRYDLRNSVAGVISNLSDYEVGVNQEGRLIYKSSGSLLDTGVVHTIEDHFIFTLSQEGSLFVVPRQYTPPGSSSSRFLFHSEITDELPVAAGNLSATQGVINYIDNLSGHFGPPNRSGLVVDELRERGASIRRLKSPSVEDFGLATIPLDSLERSRLGSMAENRQLIRDLLRSRPNRDQIEAFLSRETWETLSSVNVFPTGFSTIRNQQSSLLTVPHSRRPIDPPFQLSAPPRRPSTSLPFPNEGAHSLESIP